MIVNRLFTFGFPNFKCPCRFKYEWIKPKGHNTGIEIYNPFLKREVPLIFPDKNVVKWYICGPTVYDSTHIGHASCYIRFDIIRRALEEYFNIKPIIALGVTDLANSIFLRAKELNIEPRSLVQMYESEFFNHMKTLNVLPPHFKLKVSDKLSEIKSFVSVLNEKGLTFQREGDILFKISKDKNYGRFQSPVARKDKSDSEFAVWRGNCPGWHVECSAMASHAFGSSVDIHSGGADLTFPHHENEEALSTCYHGCEQWVNYWIHSGLVTTGDQKMSKSLGNLITVTDFLADHLNDHLRLFIMLNHYRSNLAYEKDKMLQMRQLCDRIMKFLQISHLYMHGNWGMGNIQEAELLKELEMTKLNVVESLKKDFGTAEAIKGILALMKKTAQMLASKSDITTSSSITAVASVHAVVKHFFKSFGFSLAEERAESFSVIENVIDTAVNFRYKIRSSALSSSAATPELQFCDKFRAELERLGINIYDFETGAQWTQAGTQKDHKRLLHDVIDQLVDFRGSILNSLGDCHGTVADILEEECESVKLSLATMGIVLRDLRDVHNWTFSQPDSSSTAKFNAVLMSTLKFYARMEDIAHYMDEKGTEEIKEEILNVVESGLLQLKSYGIEVKRAEGLDWTINNNNIKGESLLQNVIDIFIHTYDSIKLIMYVCERNGKEKFLEMHLALKESLKRRGFKLSKDQISQLTTWRFSGKVSHKELFFVIINETVSYVKKLKAMVENENVIYIKKAIASVHDSAIKDLEEIGIVVNQTCQEYSWRFKKFERITKPLIEDNIKSMCNDF